MKNKKLGVFAILGVLSVTGIGFGIATGEGSFLTNVEANEVGSCVNTWNKQTAPTLTQDGSGTAVAGHVETKYSKAAPLANGHVSLNDGGSIQTANTPYDETTQIGGYCNGMTSIMIEFSDKTPAQIGTVSDLELTVSFGSETTKYKTSDHSLVSGTAIQLENAPRSFKLSYSAYDEDMGGWMALGAPAANAYHCEIYGISVSSTMVEEHTLSYKTEYPINADNFELYETNETGDQRSKQILFPNKYRLTKGQVIALKPNEEYTKTLKETDLTVTGGTIKKVVTLANETQPTFFIEANGDLLVKIESESSFGVYADRAFVGKYSLFNLNKDLAPQSLELTATGALLIDGGEYQYTADDNDKISTDAKYIITQTGPVTLVYRRSNPYDRYIGIKGEGVTVQTVHGSSTNRLLTFTQGNTETKVYVKGDSVVVNGYNNATFEYATTLIGCLDTTEKNYLKITAVKNENGKSAIDDFVPRDGKLVGETENYLQVEISETNSLNGIYRDTTLAGTYTSSDTTLNIVVDGYGNATVNGGPVVSGVTYKTSTKLVTIGQDKYELNTTTKTCELPFVDPLNDGTERVYKATINGAEKTVTIKNGKIKTNCASNRSNTSYKMGRDYILTVAFEADYSGEQIAKYEFVLSKDLTTLTSRTDVILIDGYGFGDPVYNAKVECPKGTVFTLVA